jgi:hypothetical protein
MRRLFGFLRTSSVLAALLAVPGAMMCGPAAQAASPLEMNFWLSGPRYDGNVPPCEAALDKISTRFAEKESRFWNSPLQITSFTAVREVAFRPWPTDTIPRRWCTASATLNDGRTRQVHYSLIEDGGFAAYGSGVDFCVVGLDRDWAYSPRCNAAKP